MVRVQSTGMLRADATFARFVLVAGPCLKASSLGFTQWRKGPRKKAIMTKPSKLVGEAWHSRLSCPASKFTPLLSKIETDVRCTVW